MIMRKSVVAAVAVIALAACAKQDQSRVTVPAPARVSGARAKAIMHQRHEGMEKVGKTMKLLARQIKSGAPDLAAVKSGAATMNDLARKSANWFPAGTGPDVGKTGAKAEIW